MLDPDEYPLDVLDDMFNGFGEGERERAAGLPG
jgi:hypothetical protein